MTADARTDRSRVVHRLSAAIRFVDAFTAKAVTQPLDVWAEVLPAKYNDNTQLKLDVKRGENQQEYALTTK